VEDGLSAVAGRTSPWKRHPDPPGWPLPATTVDGPTDITGRGGASAQGGQIMIDDWVF